MTKKMFALTTFAFFASALAVSTPAAPVSVNTNAERAAWDALMAPEGEYAAAATYRAVIDKYGQVEPYVSILRSEEMHIQALARQLQRYGVAVPANPYLGQMTAPASLKAAAQAEVAGEKANVALYDRLMSQAAGDSQLTRVFNNLRRASQDMHMPVFAKAAAGNGSLTKAELLTLHQSGQPMANGVKGNRGTGMMAGQGQAAGRGSGQGQSQMQMQRQDCPMMGQAGRGSGQGRHGGQRGSGWRR